MGSNLPSEAVGNQRSSWPTYLRLRSQVHRTSLTLRTPIETSGKLINLVLSVPSPSPSTSNVNIITVTSAAPAVSEAQPCPNTTYAIVPKQPTQAPTGPSFSGKSGTEPGKGSRLLPDRTKVRGPGRRGDVLVTALRVPATWLSVDNTWGVVLSAEMRQGLRGGLSAKRWCLGRCGRR